ncbi:ankyrin, partial [Glonium stellatum]
LSLAAEAGHVTIVKALVEDGVDVNFPDRDGLIPLSWAAGKGHETVVQLLLTRDDIDVNSKNANNSTPLSCAAQEG